MGKQKGVYLAGKAGNVLYYSWKSIACERIIPARVYQSPAVVTHKNANGLSTTMGGSFRRLLADVIPFPKNMHMQTAVRLALLKWLKSGPVPLQPPTEIPYISAISFNEAVVFKKCLHVPLTVSVKEQNGLTVHFPGITPTAVFTAPSASDHMLIKLAAACCNMHTGEALQNSMRHITIPYNAETMPAQTIPLPLELSLIH